MFPNCCDFPTEGAGRKGASVADVLISRRVTSIWAWVLNKPPSASAVQATSGGFRSGKTKKTPTWKHVWKGKDCSKGPKSIIYIFWYNLSLCILFVSSSIVVLSGVCTFFWRIKCCVLATHAIGAFLFISVMFQWLLAQGISSIQTNRNCLILRSCS